MAPNPFFSGRIPPKLFDKANEYIKKTGKTKTQVLIESLSMYLDCPVDLFLDKIPASKEQLEALEKRISKIEDHLLNAVISPDIVDNSNLSVSSENVQLGLSYKTDNVFYPIPGIYLSEKRFGMGKSTLSSSKGSKEPDEFIAWTKSKDPDGISWKQVRDPVKGYIPAEDLPNELRERLSTWIEENIPKKPLIAKR